jgi:hypothetical protein
MGTTPFQDPLPGTTYNGFSQSEVQRTADDGWGELRIRRDDEPEPRRRRPRLSRGVVLASWAAVLSVAIGLAYVSQPRTQIEDGPPPADMRPAPEPAAKPPVLDPVPDSPPLEVAELASPPAATVAGSTDQVAEPAAAPVDPAPPSRAAKTSADEGPADDDKPLKAAHKPAPPEQRAAAEGPTRMAPSKATTSRCALKSTESAEAACRAAEMAGLRAKMGHAYVQAVKAGMTKSALKTRQAEWAVLRSKAERKGPDAVAALYRTRAAQLEALAKATARKRLPAKRES